MQHADIPPPQSTAECLDCALLMSFLVHSLSTTSCKSTKDDFACVYSGRLIRLNWVLTDVDVYWLQAESVDLRVSLAKERTQQHLEDDND